jgi:HEPN domain-containing protein
VARNQEPAASFTPGKPWSRGRDQVLRLITEGRVASVTPDGALAQRILERATGSLQAARTLLKADMGADAFEKAYSAARLTASALLEHQGLRIPGRDGAHAVVGDLIGAQLGADLGSEYQHLRHLRNDTEYPRPDKEVATEADAHEAIRYAESLLAAVTQLIETIGVFR